MIINKQTTDSEINLHKDSYLITLKQTKQTTLADNNNDNDFDDSINYLSPTSKLPNVTHIQNDDIELLLDGYFYLESNNNVDRISNLIQFLGLLSSINLKKAVSQISGGIFNLIIIDKSSASINIINDRMGLSPLFYLQCDDRLVFTNNQFNLKNWDHLSESSLLEFLKFGYLPAAPSLFENVKRMNPFSQLKIELKKLTVTETGFDETEFCNRNDHGHKSDEIISEWKIAMDKYFSRFHSKNSLIGLSGGYDSRLITAFCHDNNPVLLNYGDHDSPETGIANKIASVYSLSFINKQFPVDTIADYGPVVAERFHTVTSLENVHVLHLADSIHKASPKVYFDGYLGDVIFSDTYFANKEKSIKGALTFLFNGTNHIHKKKDNQVYVDHLYNNDKEALGDDILDGLITQNIKYEIKTRFSKFVSNRSSLGRSHEDVLERLSLMTRGRNLIAVGPTTINTHTITAIPFLDYRVFDSAMNADKELRSSHFLYNKLISKYFPEIARIRKAGNFGTAKDIGFIYRLKTLSFYFYNRCLMPLKNKFTKHLKQAEEKYFSLDAYLNNNRNRSFIESILANPASKIPERVHSAIKHKYQKGNINGKLLLRYVSLQSYLLDPS